MSTADVKFLANKCGTLMASDEYQIPLFTPEFMDKLINCTSPILFKMYLLPYMSWYDCSILKQLIRISNNKKALKMIDNFLNSLDYNKPIISYDIPEFTQLLIPLVNSHYTLLATKHNASTSEFTLSYVKCIKESLISGLEITDYAIQLIAIHNKSCCMYWLIPNQIRPFVTIKLNQVQLELWDQGIILTSLFPASFYSDENFLQRISNNMFDFLNVNTEDSIEVCICIE